ncbi:hypothetical protein OPQ81_010730 [Rhizoctonia solani]|nr:hypothetical protein OPQ81_010730 [Rhizoctonia solani]
MSTQVYFPETILPQDAFTQDAFDFSFMDYQLPVSNALHHGLPNSFELWGNPDIELDEELLNIGSNLTLEDIQQMSDFFSASLAALPQAQFVPDETPYFLQGAAAQNYQAENIIPQPPMAVPSQSPVASQSGASAPEQFRPAPAATSSETPRSAMLLTAITLLKLNTRFNPLFQKMGIVSCPDMIDLRAGMEREDAMIAAGYLPPTHIPWEQAFKLLGKQGFCTYYYSEVKKARANKIELPPVPEWITRYCFAKGAGNKPTVPNKIFPVDNLLNNKQAVAKAMLTRNNPTRRSKAAATSLQNKGKGKAVDTQRYNPYARQ